MSFMPVTRMWATPVAGAVMKLVYDDHGKPVRCTIIETVGDKPYADTMCKLMERPHFPAARDRAHAPIAYITQYYMVSGNPRDKAFEDLRGVSMAPEITLEVAKLPDGKKEIRAKARRLHLAIDRLAAFVDQQQHLALDLLLAIGQLGDFQRDLGRHRHAAICAHPEVFEAGVENDAAGKPMRYMRKTLVKLAAK